jgi:hypothetical protein
MSHWIPPADKRNVSMNMDTPTETTNFDPNRKELVVLAFRTSGNKRSTEMRVLLPSRQALAFHWWMVTTGVVKA